MVPSSGPEREVAQRFCDDVVLDAGCFKPNAPGRWELSSLRALTERQLLKSRGAYFAERLLIAVTPVELVAVAIDAMSLLRIRRIVWPLRELTIQVVPSRAGAHNAFGPALLLSNRRSLPCLEIVPIADDRASGSLIDRLVPGGVARDRV